MRKCKIFLSFLIVISMFFSLSMPIYAVNIKKDIQPRAWPGRPGGNGDGSEEWLVGEYAKPNGPYRIIAIDEGSVQELKDSEKMQLMVATTLLSVATLYLTHGITFFSIPVKLRNLLPKSIGAGIVTSVVIDKITDHLKSELFEILLSKSFYHQFKGKYYKAEIYVSGRSMKTVYKTYEDASFTKYVATYTRTIGW